MRTDRAGNPAPVGRLVGAPITISLSTTSARATLKALTAYRLWGSVDCFVQFGDGTVVATTTSNPLTAKISEQHITDSDNTSVAGIVSTGTGTLFISEVAVD